MYGVYGKCFNRINMLYNCKVSFKEKHQLKLVTKL